MSWHNRVAIGSDAITIPPPFGSAGRSRLMARLMAWCERNARRSLQVAVLVAIAFHLIRVFDSSRDEYEGGMMQLAERMGWSLPDPTWTDRIPYTVCPYGPVYFAVTKAVSKVGPWAGTLIPGRLVSVAAGILTALLIGLVVNRRTASAELGLSAALFYLVYPRVAFWMHDYRVDTLAALFAIGAYTALELPGRGLQLSTASVVVGSLVKQPVAFAAIPITLHLILSRKPREAVLYLLSVLVVGGAAWGLVVYASRGYYLNMALLGNRRAYFPSQAMHLAAVFFGNPVTIVTVLSVAVASIAEPMAVLRCRYAVAGAMALALAIALSGGEGAATNYYLESAALMSLFLGLYPLTTFWALNRRRTAGILGVIGLVTTVAIGAYTVKALRSGERRADLTSVADQVKNRCVLADRQYVAPAVSAGLVPAVNDPYFYRVAVRNGAIDAGRLADDMRAGRVGGLVLAKPREQYARGSDEWPPEITAVMLSDFAACGRADSGYLYVHRFPE
jgi:hypothetical protein